MESSPSAATITSHPVRLSVQAHTTTSAAIYIEMLRWGQAVAIAIAKLSRASCIAPQHINHRRRHFVQFRGLQRSAIRLSIRREPAMKQKIVIRVQMECDRCRSKALALVAATGGVDSVSLAGDGRDQVVVVGDGVDSVKLTNALRRKVGPAEIVQLAEAKKEGGGGGGGGNNPPAPAAAAVTALPEFVASSPWYYHYQPYPQPAAVVYEHPAAGYACAYGYQTRTDSICSIM